jgi:hypothetical protein
LNIYRSCGTSCADTQVSCPPTLNSYQLIFTQEFPGFICLRKNISLHISLTTIYQITFDLQKRTAYARLEQNGYESVPVSVEVHGRLSQPAMKPLHTLGGEAAGPGGDSRASFVEGPPWELRVGLVRGNYVLYRVSVGMLARSSGACFRLGLAQPTDDCCAE